MSCKILNNHSFNKDRIKKLLDYIIVEPSEDTHNKAHKYPFIAAEILCCDATKIHELFLKNENKFEASVQDSNQLQPENNFKNHHDDEANDEIEEEITVEETKTKAASITIDENQLKSKSSSNLEDLRKSCDESKKNESENFFKNELLEYFLSFIETNSDLNYVLSGYFSRFFNFLFSKNASLVFSK